MSIEKIYLKKNSKQMTYRQKLQTKMSEKNTYFLGVIAFLFHFLVFIAIFKIHMQKYKQRAKKYCFFIRDIYYQVSLFFSLYNW